MKCPACGHDNLDGADRCEECMESLRDLDVPHPRHGFQARLMMDPVSKIHSPSPVPVLPSDTVMHAATIMRNLRAGAVVVVDNDKLVGILSEVDLLFREGAHLETSHVSDFMTRNPESLDADSSIASALHLMSVGGYRHVPVVQENRVVGIISIKDVLRYLKQQLL